MRLGALLSSLPDGLADPLFFAAQVRRLKAGEVLFAAGDAGDGCYRLDRGLLKVTVTSPQGEHRIIAVRGPGSIVGELAIIDGLPRSAAVIALRDCVLRFVSRQAFEQRVKSHPEAYQALLAIVATRLREADEALAATTFLSVKGRVARALLELAQHVGQESDAGHVVLQEISQGDLAAMAGSAREYVSRVLSDWRRRNIVTGGSRCYCLHDVAALKREMNSGS
jgi:CRP-like cAMP-binding protein